MSYSRVDQVLVRRLYDALVAQGREVWVDWEAIRPSAEWFAEIERGIRSVNSFVFLISPDSIDSEICLRELELAEALNKRLVPVVVRDTPTVDVPAALRRHNWVFLRDEDDFAAGLSALMQALDTDIDWLHAHTEQLLQALAWSDAGQDKSRLLKGMALQQAESWLAQAAGKDPPPGAVQLAYIQASRRGATRRLRWLVGITATGMVMALALTAWALFASYAAQLARDEAVARRLGAEASLVATERDSLIERSALLAIESWRRSPSLQNDVPLRRALSLLPRPVAGWGVWTEPVDAAVPLGNGGGVAFAVSGRSGKAVVKIALPGNETPRTLPHASRLRALASCADGRWLATLTVGGRVFLWDLATPAGGTLLAHKPYATQIRCAGDGDLLAVGSRNGQVALFRASDGRRVLILDEPLESAVRSLSLDTQTGPVAASRPRISKRIAGYHCGEYDPRGHGHAGS